MGVVLEQHETCILLRLEGVLGVGDAAELKARLVEALHDGKALRILPGKLSYLDVTAVQLLWASAREAEKHGQRLSLEEPFPESVIASLREAGLELEFIGGEATGNNEKCEKEMDRA